MLDAVDIAYPEDKGSSLSNRIVVHDIDTVLQNLPEQLLGKSFEWYSLELDECIDVQDTTQLLVFIREIDDNLQLVKKKKTTKTKTVAKQ